MLSNIAQNSSWRRLYEKSHLISVFYGINSTITKMMKFLTVIFFTLMAVAMTFAVQNEGLENCECIATMEYLPLCASNGVTYSSKSLLECAKKCLLRNDLVKVHDGPCENN